MIASVVVVLSMGTRSGRLVAYPIVGPPSAIALSPPPQSAAESTARSLPFEFA